MHDHSGIGGPVRGTVGGLLDPYHLKLHTARQQVLGVVLLVRLSQIGAASGLQRSGDARLAVLQGVQGGGTAQIRLRDIILALDHAAKDRDINSVLLTTDGLSGGGLPLQREIASAITRFRATGKKVVAWGMNYDQRAYFLAAHADEVYLHPMGAVYLDGYGRRRNYYRDALDRLGISVNVVRAGRYKNALETFTANAPSPETQEAVLLESRGAR